MSGSGDGTAGQQEGDNGQLFDGELPIIEYASRRGLSIEARIRLFLPVCDAIERANSSLTAHGAIDAGNILVDSAGTARLADSGPLPGEQGDASADVYALGLLLFELLSGERPDISPENPLPEPSELADGPTARILKGDLDAIVLKAMAGEPAESYPGAADLAADLHLYLQRLPVHARTGGKLYRIGRFNARHHGWWVVAAVLAVGAAASLAIVWERHAQRRMEALHRIDEIRSVIDHLPVGAAARESAVQQQLQTLDNMSREPDIDRAVKRELAEAYLSLGSAQESGIRASPGQPAEARASYRKGVTLLSDVARSAPSDVRAQTDLALAKNRLAVSLRDTDNIKAAIDLLQEEADSLELFSREQALDAPAKLVEGMTYYRLAEFHRAFRQPRLSLQAQLRSRGIFGELAEKNAENREAQAWYANSERHLAALYWQLNQPAQAAESLDTAIQIDKQRVDRNAGDAEAGTDLTLVQTDLAALLRRNGDLPGAEKLFEAAISEGKAALEADAGSYQIRYLLATYYEQLGDLLSDEKRPAEALVEYREGSALADMLGPKASGDLEAQKVIASLRAKAGEAPPRR